MHGAQMHALIHLCPQAFALATTCLSPAIVKLTFVMDHLGIRSVITLLMRFDLMVHCQNTCNVGKHCVVELFVLTNCHG